MARPKSTIRTVPVHISLPEDLADKVELMLYSELEGKVPHGEKSKFFTQLVTEHFRTQVAAAIPDVQESDDATD